MAIVKQCDRCGTPFRYIDASEINAIETQHSNKCNTSYRAINFYDLCPKCVTDFRKWLNGGEHETSK